MELGLESAVGQGGMDIGNGRSEVCSFSRLDGSEKDEVAVVVIGHKQVIVTGAGRLWQSAHLVGVNNVVGRRGG